jgi:uncharacterized protein involved in outer membrane biogenesis
MAANFRGRLALADAFYQQLRLQGLQSKVTINQQYLTLTDLRVQLLGGTAQGQVKLSRQRQGVSQLQADFTGVNLTPLALIIPSCRWMGSCREIFRLPGLAGL